MNSILQRLTNTQAIVASAFAILLVAGQAADLLKPISEPLLGPDYQPYVFPVLMVAAIALVLHALILAPRPQARLARPEALRLRRDSRSHLVGRQDEIDSLIALATRSPLLFIVGESGVGKSALLGAGVAPQLAERGNLLPVYIESLAGPDWDDDAWRLLFLALQPMLSDEQRKAAALNGLPDPADRKRILESLRSATARTPFIIIDQFDDYQARHWGRFQNNGSWIKAAEIVERNSFWRALAELVGDGKVHLAVVTRSDTALGLESVRFREPETYEVPRLSTEFIGQLLNSITSTASGEEAVIENPEAGWTALRDRLIDDLARTGAVLPQQLKIALLGLAALPRQLLSVAAYERVGRIAGLEAEWIRARIKRAEQAGGLDETQTLALLLALIDPDKPRKTRELASATLAAEAGIDDADRDRLARSLAQLETDEIIRRRRDPGEASDRWRLDHDYLTGVVREAHRRADAWTARLKEGEEALATAGRHWARRWRALLSMGTQLRFLWDRARGRFRYGAHRRYAVRSGARFLPLATIVATGLAGAWYLDRQVKTREFVDRITAAFDERRDLSDLENVAIQELALADPRMFDDVLAKLLSSDSHILRLNANLASISRAMRWQSDEAIGADAAGQLLEAMQRTSGNPAIMFEVADVLAPISGRLRPEQASAAAALMVAGIERGEAEPVDQSTDLGRHAQVMAIYYRILSDFPEGLTRDQATALISRLLNRMMREGEGSGSTISQFEVIDFVRKRPDDEVRAAAARILAAIGNTANADLKGRWIEILGILADRLSGEQAAETGRLILTAMERIETRLYRLAQLAEGLGRLGNRASADQIERAATLMIEAMTRSLSADQMIRMGSALSELGDRVHPRHGAQAARLIAASLETNEAMTSITGGSAQTCSAVGPFAQGMPAEEASAMAARLQAGMERAASETRRLEFVRLLAAFGARLPPQTALVAARRIVAAAESSHIVTNVDDICAALTALAGRMPAAAAAQMRARLERRLASETSAERAGELTVIIVALSANLSPDLQVERIFRALADPLTSDVQGAMVDRLAAIARREFDDKDEQNAYRWLAGEQRQGRLGSVRLEAIAADMRGIFAARLAALRAQRRPAG